MIIKIDLQSDIALYEQLYTCIIEAIATGQLRSGESLPTVRQLGTDLGINLHTVSKAYNILKLKGFLSINRSKGAVINAPAIYSATEGNINMMRSQLKPTISECIARGMNSTDISSLVNDVLVDIREGK